MSSKDLNLSVLREVAKREFFALFPANASKEGGRHAGDSHGSSAAIQPKPVVYVDPSLVPSFRALGVIDSDAAREAGLGSYLVLTPELLASGAKPSSVGSSPSCVSYFFIQGQELQRCMRSVRVMMQILEMRPSTGSPTARIVFVPKGSAACQEILTRTYDLSNRFGGTVTVSEFALDFIPLCDDVLSMELPQLFNSGVLDGDPTLGMSVARSLYKLQAVHLGHIPHVRGKGRLANHIARMIKRLQSELGGGSDANALPALVDTMILFDRGEMDPLTPLVTQLTYEGLLEEFYSDTKTSERITLPSDSEQTARAPVLDAEGKPLGTVMLDPTTDTVFAEIRDMNIANVGPTLNQKTLHIKAVYEKRHGMQALSELRDFMKQLPEIQQQHKQVGVHTAITAAVRSETLKPEFRKRIEMEQCLFSGDGERDVGDYLEECIGRRDPLPQVLRLLCIFSHCSSTWRARTYEQFRESLVQSYGALPCLVLLSKLERAGFLRKPDARSVMSNLRKPLQLFTPPRHTETYPDGIAFAYSGYAPPLVRLAEVACRARLGWKAMDSLLNLFPGESYADDSGTDVLGNTRFVLVVFLGGITCAEISTLRFLSSKEKDDGVQVRFIVATTQVINGNNVLQLIV